MKNTVSRTLCKTLFLAGTLWTGGSLCAGTPQAHNTFEHSDNLSLCDFRDMHIRNGKLLVTLPELSIVTIAL